MNYTNLKTLMSNRGYQVSEGSDWLAADTPQFIAFATRELGISYSVANHMLAYSQAFPKALRRLEDMELGLPQVSAPSIPAEPNEPNEPETDQPAAGDEQDPNVLSMSAPNQMPKEDPVQELPEDPDDTNEDVQITEPAPDPDLEQEADESEENSEGSEDDVEE